MTSRFASAPAPVAVILSDGSSMPLNAGTAQGEAGTGHWSGQRSAVSAALRGGDPVVPFESPRRCNPHEIQRDFPLRWQAYIRTNYRNLSHVQQVFGVSGRAARKWWNGEGGARGAQVAIAVSEHPVAASRILFAEG